ncbi:DUF1963 domain-containing protein [Streptomyces sp. NPDC087425]|uniref:DUF1963 domain-containing protein n=1 Tax=Streptomyces sp. NPDC087425 TaxID=3365787 RepID=UPI0037FD4244
MNSELLGRLGPFRDEAAEQGIPDEDVERWIATARPAATLVTRGEGPVVGRFGGPLMLPADAPTPWSPLLATLDCAALSDAVTGLQLPPDGSLLLLGFPDPAYPYSAGEVVYVPAGAPVEERIPHHPSVPGNDGTGGNDLDGTLGRIYEQFPDEELRLAADVSLPFHGMVTMEEPPYAVPLPGHPRSGELAELWRKAAEQVVADGPLQIGGYASHECVEGDPVRAAASDALGWLRDRAARSGGSAEEEELPAPEEWVLLAQWDGGLDGREGSTLHWVIPRGDLAEGRVDRAYVSFFWNP